MMIDQNSVPECTPACRSTDHARKILRLITNHDYPVDYVKSYMRFLCLNFNEIRDDISGKNVLHLASSIGNLDLVEWLIKHCHCDIDSKDLESGWTSLHRGLYYRQVKIARILLKNGASLTSTDFNGFSPLDLLISDRLPHIDYHSSDPCDAYVFGSNENLTLGIPGQQCKNPELLNIFAKKKIFIKKVILRKFHTTFLSVDGKVYTCGYGNEGRLGTNNEEISIIPKLVSDTPRIDLVASSQDHILYLVEGGRELLSSGSNSWGQLGHIPYCQKSLVPKPVNLKHLKMVDKILGIAASRYHSVFHTKNKIYTWGLNGGQLGHSEKEKNVHHPKQVTSLVLNGFEIHLVDSSDAATVFSTKNGDISGDIFVLHQFQCRKIGSHINVKKLCVTGGCLDTTDVKYKQELRVLILTHQGFIYIWKESDPNIIRCLIRYSHEIMLVDAFLNMSEVLLVSDTGEAFSGTINYRKKKENDKPDTQQKNLSAPRISRKQNNNEVFSLLKFFEKDDCHTMKVKRLPFLHRVVAVTSDEQNNNFCFLQVIPRIGVTEVPEEPNNCIDKDFRTLLDTTNANDTIHDIVVSIGKQKRYALHKYILAYRSEFFKKKIQADPNCDLINIDSSFVTPEAFEQIIKFIYTNTNDFLTNGKQIKWPQPTAINRISPNNPKKKIVSNPVQELREMSKKLGVTSLAKLLNNENIKVDNNVVRLNKSVNLSEHKLDRLSLTELYDITLKSSDGVLFSCHKCVLVSRVNYFKCMLGSSWLEVKSNSSVKFPSSAKVLDFLLRYIYGDEIGSLLASEDPSLICELLAMADQFLIPDLKMTCEFWLADQITLKNVCDLLDLSYIYNSAQLKRSCQNYICCNLAAIIELNCWDLLTTEAMEDLTKYYQSLPFRYRVKQISKDRNVPSLEELQEIDKMFTSAPHHEYQNPKLSEMKEKRHSKAKVQKKNSLRKPSESVTSETDIEIHKKDKSDSRGCEDNVLPKDISSGPILIPVTEERYVSKMEEIKASPPIFNKNSLSWGQTAGPTKMLSMRDIFKEQDVSKKDESRFLLLSRSPSKTQEISESKPVKHFTSLQSTSSNPWKISDLAASPPSLQPFIQNSPTMSEIIREEEILDRSQHITKPLDVITKEDVAIEELQNFYKLITGSFDEVIHVERVLPEKIKAPIWKR